VKEGTHRIIVGALGAASLLIGLSLLAGVRALASPGVSYIVGMSGLLCGALLLRISLGVRRVKRRGQAGRSGNAGQRQP
jgi:hypothetical protein